MKNAKDVKDALKASEISNIMNVANVVNVWSNGSKIGRYAGQGEGSSWHNPNDGYRKMVAILVEVDEEVNYEKSRRS
ncbi:hypothetical protein P8891_06185 [Bacillus atrophaeus]|uniref:hypothetical protein n=1 Tax=Bacillus atrophaeus TaxID=1452 RepID=UPI00227F8CD7|nr:hypothetical protein [Bacillus atrophaeus]MCY7948032.1 hypothetical protein [Bacillus atrophaeus]MCY8098023.1 hypothetical protein [Bacillus atrophaeus]MCY9169947.1 hypothetical protein [Bacillus atrophaeus]MEC0740672.1 hypothetical protein [Bacillus atrophaeus]MEC0747064.1 hypothetical protein [Bacillus atrophaeus]